MDVHQRINHTCSGEEIGGEESIECEEEEEEEEMYLADDEEYHERQKYIKLVDPGPFQYNRKVCVAALPCFLLILAICGEMLVLLMCAGIALILIVDTGSKNQRTMVVFIMIFVPCHITILYFTFPLIWVSFMNIILLALINAFILLSGGWAVLQIAIFRMQEHEICIFLEQLLFTMYPGLAACLMTWAASTVIPFKFVSFVLQFISFILFQVYMTPTISSFKSKSAKEDEDTNILNQHQQLLLAAVFILLPFCVHTFIGIYQISLAGFLQFHFLCEILLLLCCSLFLTTFFSIRQMTEHYGLTYDFLVKMRWICGALTAILLYPVLYYLGIVSHFLSWLPLAIAIYAAYGVLLSYKKYKRWSLASLALCTFLTLTWAIKLPWQLSNTFLFGVNLSMMFSLMIVNSLLCLSTAFAASYTSPAFVSMLVLLQTSMFICGEVILFESGLYNWILFIVTSVMASYTVHRLQQARKIALGVSCACISSHLTKSVEVMMYKFVHQSPTVVNVLTLYFMMFMIIRLLVSESANTFSNRKLAVNIVLMCLSVVLNMNPVLYILSSYLLGVDASTADALGFCFVICGLLMVATCVIHIPDDVPLRKQGIMGIIIGIGVILTQPAISFTSYGIFQLFVFVSILLLILLVSSDLIRSLEQIIAVSFVTGTAPGIQAAFYMYSDGFVPIPSVILFCLTVICLLCTVLCFTRSENMGSIFERATLTLCLILVVLSVASLVVDLLLKERTTNILSVPSWKIFLGSNIVICLCQKLLVTRQSQVIPLHKQEDKEVPYLPVVGNITAYASFLLICLMSPTFGFLHDIWCCGAAIILICAQKDMKLFFNLKQENQTSLTKITAIIVLMLGTLYRSDLWHSTSWTFARSLVEVILTLTFIPHYYTLWGILWRSTVLLPEVVVVFSLPLNFALLLYGSSYTSWALACTGFFSALWMMSTSFKLTPNSGLI